VRKITLLACLVCCLAVPAGAQAAWSTDGRCVVPAKSKAALDHVRPKTQLVARRVACYKAASSVQGMVENGVEYSRADRFTYRASGARWAYRWSCTRRIGRARVPNLVQVGTREHAVHPLLVDRRPLTGRARLERERVTGASRTPGSPTASRTG
jgi:hypothetical protein